MEERQITERILVTGCCGFIGGHLSAKLCELGFDVTGIDWMKFYEKRKIKTYTHSLYILISHLLKAISEVIYPKNHLIM